MGIFVFFKDSVPLKRRLLL